MRTIEIDLVVDDIELTAVLDEKDNDLLEIRVGGFDVMEYMRKEFIDKVENKLFDMGYPFIGDDEEGYIRC
jgi:hypothetical protein